MSRSRPHVRAEALFTHPGGIQRRQLFPIAERSSFLERRGFKVIRFWNHEVLAQTDRVLEAIRHRIEESMGSPTP